MPLLALSHAAASGVALASVLLIGGRSGVAPDACKFVSVAEVTEVLYVDPRIAIIGYSGLAWAFGWLVSATAVRLHPIWRTPALVATGRYSYGLYVFHPLVDAVVKAHWPTGYGGLRSGLLVIGGSFVVAYVSYHAYEKWFLRLKGRLAPR